jgi:hypothetical protein
MLSMPTETKASPAPMAMAPAAMWIAYIEEPQKRLTVAPAMPIGRSASSPISRATFSPCSASGKAQPTIKSSRSSAFTFVRSMSARTTSAAISSGRTRTSPPFRAGAKGERA